MTATLSGTVQSLAQRRGVHLAPNWASRLDEAVYNADDAGAVEALCKALNWPAPRHLSQRPRANVFPFLIHNADTGWVLAEQWENADHIRVIGKDGVSHLRWSDELVAVDVVFPASGQRIALGTGALGIVRSAIMRRKRMLAEVALATVTVNVIALAVSIYSMQVYDRVIPSNGFSTLSVLTAGVMLALFIDFLTRNARAFLLDSEAAAIDAELSEYFFQRMQSVRLDAQGGGIGTMAAQMRGLEQVRSVLSAASVFVLADLPFVLVFVLVMAAIGGAISLVPLVIFPVSIALALLFSRLIRADTEQTQVTSNRKNGLLVEALDGAETIKANLGGWHMLAKWNNLVDDVNAHDLRVRRLSNLASSTFGLLSQISYVAIVAWGAYRIVDGEITTGGVIACSIIGGRITGPLVAALPGLIVQWGYARSSIAALDQLIQAPSDHPEDQQKLRIANTAGALRVDNMVFIHPGTRSGVGVPRLDIRPGERVGLIGPIGSGKSTFLRLLSGLYAPQQGAVFLDGMEIRQIADDELRRHICYLPQDYRLLGGTLRENLCLGLPDPRDEILIDAATRTGLVDLIKAHPKGLELPISEDGRGLSGGQRALVGLTRALLARPCILLLDEPTAGLDGESEARVLNALNSVLQPDTTLLIVTHKMQLTAMVQRLVVMKGGTVVLDGPRKDVLSKLTPRSEPASKPEQNAEKV